ncbi:hypothetical protein SAMN04487910_3363 [Aquimarina amphilecti]|uniref:Uncharacterized protein n=1 Tax=Aquimarina amphilecti TaxID=1038014 RepID=A0A1H7TEJ1_AQUAM|nr:hypothetical protein SAMN04487910_3363 [Aquimarina amphilecti]
MKYFRLKIGDVIFTGRPVGDERLICVDWFDRRMIFFFNYN